MFRFLKFDAENRAESARLGIPFEWLCDVFLGEERARCAPPFLGGMPPDQQFFWNRETSASRANLRWLEERGAGWVDPWAPAQRCRALVSLTADRRGALPFDLLPVFYACRSATGEIFWLCVYSTFDRLTQVIFPQRRLVVFDIHRETAEAVLASLTDLVARHGKDIEAAVADGRLAGPRFVGLLDMVTNFAHQAINHLSGLERLAAHGLLDRIDEFWVCGTQFFGDVERLYPEIRERVRHFPDRWALLAEMLRRPTQLARIGSTYLPSSLRRKILRRARGGGGAEVSGGGGQPHGAVLVVTVRSMGRRCVNLAEVVAAIHARLAARLPLQIAIDGWVIPESECVAASSLAAAMSADHLDAVREDLALARALERALPRGAVVANTIGRSMLESLGELGAATAYFAHVGTLQHKLGLLLGLPGVVHGPRSQLLRPEGGPYLSEDGRAPVFLAESCVVDVETRTERGESCADYRIVDIEACVDALAGVLGAARPAGDP